MKPTHIDFDSVELFKLPISATHILDDYVLIKHGLELETMRDHMLKGMMYQIKTYILAEEVDNRTKDVRFSVRLPSSWWQHFKYSKFPSWLLRKFPVKYAEYGQIKTVRFRRVATYPKANILFPDKVGELVRYKSFIGEIYPTEGLSND